MGRPGRSPAAARRDGTGTGTGAPSNATDRLPGRTVRATGPEEVAMDLAEHPAGNEPPVVNSLGERVALGPHWREQLPTYQRWISDFAALRTLGAGPPEPTTME